MYATRETVVPLFRYMDKRSNGFCTTGSHGSICAYTMCSISRTNRDSSMVITPYIQLKINQKQQKKATKRTHHIVLWLTINFGLCLLSPNVPNIRKCQPLFTCITFPFVYSGTEDALLFTHNFVLWMNLSRLSEVRFAEKK